MSRVELAKIKSLTFYKDSYTAARRTSSLPQAVCVGKPCKLFQPDVVRCVSLGGTGTEVNWKCEADLPDTLRFGRVEVSCEGWSSPGDPYVLKGSCSLEYRLVQIPDSLHTSDSPIFSPKDYDWASMFFWIVWFGFIALVLYSVFLSCRSNRNSRSTPRPSSNNPPRRPSSGSGWFPGDHHDNYPSDPPPPYPKYQEQDAPPTWQNWRPGFWTGAALGGLANRWWNGPRTTEVPVRRTAYDWERPSFFGRGSGYSTRQPTTPSDSDRGEGSSNLGPMRRSTGLGGSSVR